MNRNGRGYAFPTNMQTNGGLTKREYFAAKAMQGIIASNEGGHDVVVTARISVNMADALLQALAESND